MKSFKLSKYNIFVNKISESYIYNLLSNVLFKVAPDLANYLKSEKKNNFPDLQTELLEKFIKSGIILNSTEEEMNLLHYGYHKDKYADSFMSLVIIPTFKCNFNCHYCYEKNKSSIMSEEKFEILKNFIINESKTKKFIATRWFGGEPLLVWDRIHKYSLEIIKACKENNCKYISSIVSNGYLLSESIIQEMLIVGISSIQITVDGNPEIHDSVRFLKDGTGSFDKILRSIEIASKYMKVIVRLNVDKDNVDHFDELFKILNNSDINKENVLISCKPIVCSYDRKPQNPIFSDNEFYSVEKKLIHLGAQNDLNYAFHIGTSSIRTRCIYHTSTAFMVDTNLNLFKCPLYIGGDLVHSVGHIDAKGLQITNREEYLKTLSYSPFDLSECKQCKVLPICKGKCPIQWEKSGRAKEEGCIPDKYSVEKKIFFALENKVFQFMKYNTKH